MYDYDKKVAVYRRLGLLGLANLVMSLVAIVIGSFAVQNSDQRFPYNAGGGIIVGTWAIFLSCCPIYSFYKFNSYNKDSDCCMLCLAIYFGIAVLTPPLGIGMAGIYGLVECSKPGGGVQGVCLKNKDSKVTLCILTIVVSSVLLVLELCIFFSCCCNASLLDLNLTNNTTSRVTFDEVRVSSYFQSAERSGRRMEGRGPAVTVDGRHDTGTLEQGQQWRAMGTRGEEQQWRRGEHSGSGGASATVPSAPIDINIATVDLEHGMGNQSTIGDAGRAPYIYDDGTDDLTVELDEQFVSYERHRDALRHEDPPPSYDEVMRTS